MAVINAADEPGGAESVARMLRDGLEHRGHDAALWVGRQWSPDNAHRVRVIPASDAQRAAARRFLDHGFFSLGVRSSHAFAGSPALAGADVVHLHNAHGHYLCLTALPPLATRAPLVWTLHDHFAITGGCAFPQGCDRWRTTCGSCPQLGRYPLMTTHDRTRWLHQLKRRRFADLPVTLVTPSRHLARAVEQSGMFGRAELRVIPYGVDTALFTPQRASARQTLGLAADARVVLLIAQGLDDPRKGVRHAVSALHAVEEPRLTVLLIGDGDDRAIRHALARHDVRALGLVRDRCRLAQAFAAADLLLFTSLAENFPCVVLEAMASATAVLAFGIPGVDEQLIAGDTGFVVEPGDGDALARSARQLLIQPDRLHDAGLAARAYVEQHLTIGHFIDAHEVLYHEVRAAAPCSTA